MILYAYALGTLPYKKNNNSYLKSDKQKIVSYSLGTHLCKMNFYLFGIEIYAIYLWTFVEHHKISY